MSIWWWLILGGVLCMAVGAALLAAHVIRNDIKNPSPPAPRQQLTHEAGVLIEMWERGGDLKRNEVRAKWPDLGVHLDDMLKTYDELVKT